MQNLKQLLPIGSVILLKGMEKKIVIIGAMPVVRTKANNHIAYDYLGVPYPEGFMDLDKSLLFMHEDITEVVFEGYTDKEREFYIGALSEFIAETNAVVNSAEPQAE